MGSIVVDGGPDVRGQRQSLPQTTAWRSAARRAARLCWRDRPDRAAGGPGPGSPAMLQSRFSVRTGLASLALACAAGTASGAQAATAVPVSTAPPLAIEELQELDEVVVHGTNLRDRIIRAEDRFFRLYN